MWGEFDQEYTDLHQRVERLERQYAELHRRVLELERQVAIIVRETGMGTWVNESSVVAGRDVHDQEVPDLSEPG
jgi:hypothetical protein